MDFGGGDVAGAGSRDVALDINQPAPCFIISIPPSTAQFYHIVEVSRVISVCLDAPHQVCVQDAGTSYSATTALAASVN